MCRGPSPRIEEEQIRGACLATADVRLREMIVLHWQKLVEMMAVLLLYLLSAGVVLAYSNP